ncbi:S-methyl-5-thioribose-1-phosphate isomerase [Candidatus Woesearchaeota archaeon]|nr:S-methyl-5-thioribose-1-phosphate isomerase [Candidatus Woesearchaeota archaeon]
MLVNNVPYRTIFLKPSNAKAVHIIDQRALPFKFAIEELINVDDTAKAIREMHIRGAGAIGAAAGFGMYLAALEAPQNIGFGQFLRLAGKKLIATRPTAVNLSWAVERQLDAIAKGTNFDEKISIALETAQAIADEDVEQCRKIGEHGLKLIEEISKKKDGQPVNIMTHCNAGWLAFVDIGTATAPLYLARQKGIKAHVFVSETRPRNQGASLTAWELENEKVPYSLIVDNAAGHLLQRGMVDMIIVGCDRCSRNGDVANKIGTYLKAVAAKENNIPFYAAVPSSSIDFRISDGLKEIHIEQRDEDEVKSVTGKDEKGNMQKVILAPEKSRALNFGFDVTPARLITGLITEKGVCKADEENLMKLFPERKG